MLATTGDVGIYWTNKWNWRRAKSYELPDSLFCGIPTPWLNDQGVGHFV